MIIELLQTANRRINMVRFYIVETALPERKSKMSYVLLSGSIGGEQRQIGEFVWCSGWAAFDQATGRLLLYVAATDSTNDDHHKRCSSSFYLNNDCLIPANELTALGIREGDLYLPARVYPAIHLDNYALSAIALCRAKENKNTALDNKPLPLSMAS
jgi:hypothetical protein